MVLLKILRLLQHFSGLRLFLWDYLCRNITLTAEFPSYLFFTANSRLHNNFISVVLTYLLTYLLNYLVCWITIPSLHYLSVLSRGLQISCLCVIRLFCNNQYPRKRKLWYDSNWTDYVFLVIIQVDNYSQLFERWFKIALKNCAGLGNTRQTMLRFDAYINSLFYNC